jgi:hypothetical protein
VAATGFQGATRRHPPEENATTKPKTKVEATSDTANGADDDMPMTTDDDLDADGPAGIDDIEDLEDLDVDNGDLDDAVLDDDEDSGDDSDLADGDDDLADGDDVPVEVPVAKIQKAVEPEAEADDDELLADEVEASLDVILAERLRGDDTEDDEVEADEEEDDGLPNQLATVIPVRQPDEFLCQSCFLLKPPGQLADRDHQLCRDCA